MSIFHMFIPDTESNAKEINKLEEIDVTETKKNERELDPGIRTCLFF